MKSKLKISNSISISINIAAFITMWVFGIMYLVEYIIYKTMGPGHGTMGAYLGLTVFFMLICFSLIPLSGIILSSILFHKLDKELSYKQIRVLGGLLVPFGLIFNGVVILALSKKNKESFNL